MNEKQRIDLYLVENKLVESREKAQALIMAGQVYVNNQKCEKPGNIIKRDAQVEVRGNPLPYVSRGGLKLEKALSAFSLELTGAVAIDIGASTGGFTDCMLQNGVRRVYAVDVGYGQLDWKLRNDPRVVCLERTNMRYVTSEQIPETVDFFSVDVSFISLTKILPVAAGFLRPEGRAVCLIKPQFEAGRDKVGKKGVVRDPAVHWEVIEKIRDFSLENGFSVLGLTYSPVKGPEGNIEYLILLEKSDRPTDESEMDIEALVAVSHSELTAVKDS